MFLSLAVFQRMVYVLLTCLREGATQRIHTSLRQWHTYAKDSTLKRVFLQCSSSTAYMSLTEAVLSVLIGQCTYRTQFTLTLQWASFTAHTLRTQAVPSFPIFVPRRSVCAYTKFLTVNLQLSNSTAHVSLTQAARSFWRRSSRDRIWRNSWWYVLDPSQLHAFEKFQVSPRSQELLLSTLEPSESMMVVCSRPACCSDTFSVLPHWKFVLQDSLLLGMCDLYSQHCGFFTLKMASCLDTRELLCSILLLFWREKS